MRVKSRDADGLLIFIYSPDATHLDIELQPWTTCKPLPHCRRQLTPLLGGVSIGDPPYGLVITIAK